jgi:hypothetical protein
VAFSSPIGFYGRVAWKSNNSRKAKTPGRPVAVFKYLAAPILGGEHERNDWRFTMHLIQIPTSETVTMSSLDMSLNGALVFLLRYLWTDRQFVEKSGREEEVLAACIRHAGAGGDADTVTLAVVRSRAVTVEHLAALPCDKLLKYTKNFSPEVGEAFAQLLREEVAVLDVSGLDQFERLVAEFPGTVGELVAVCRAAVSA